MKIFAVLVSLSLSSLAQAGFSGLALPPLMLGHEPLRGVTSDSSCRVLFYDATEPLPREICSGAIIGATEVLTAAHCMSDLDAPTARISVECGYRGPIDSVEPGRTRSGTLIHEKDELFKERREAAAIEVSSEDTPGAANGDLAKITLSRPSSLPPARIAVDSERRTYLTPQGMAPGIECRTDGFGFSADDSAGKAMTAPLSPEVRTDPQSQVITLSEETVVRSAEEGLSISCLGRRAPEVLDPLKAAKLARDIERVFERQGRFSLMLSPGDSGGPLYCRAKANGAWTLVGVGSRGSLGYRPSESGHQFDVVRHQEIWTPIEMPSSWTEVWKKLD